MDLLGRKCVSIVPNANICTTLPRTHMVEYRYNDLRYELIAQHIFEHVVG